MPTSITLLSRPVQCAWCALTAVCEVAGTTSCRMHLSTAIAAATKRLPGRIKVFSVQRGGGWFHGVAAISGTGAFLFDRYFRTLPEAIAYADRLRRLHIT